FGTPKTGDILEINPGMSLDLGGGQSENGANTDCTVDNKFNIQPGGLKIDWTYKGTVTVAKSLVVNGDVSLSGGSLVSAAGPRRSLTVLAGPNFARTEVQWRRTDITLDVNVGAGVSLRILSDVRTLNFTGNLNIDGVAAWDWGVGINLAGTITNQGVFSIGG